MKHETKTITNTANLREQADTAVAAWRTANAEAAAAAAEHSKAPTGSLAAVVAEARRFETKDVATLARVTATTALAAAEVAEGDELAIACDPTRLHDDLAALLVDEERKRGEYEEAGKRRAARAAASADSFAKLAARRSAALLPPPVHLPSLAAYHTALLAELARVVADGFAVPPQMYADRVRSLRSQETQILADRERKLRKQEEEAAKAAKYVEWERQNHARAEKAAATERAANRAKQEAELAETQALADANRARTAG